MEIAPCTSTGENIRDGLGQSIRGRGVGWMQVGCPFLLSCHEGVGMLPPGKLP